MMKQQQQHWPMRLEFSGKMGDVWRKTVVESSLDGLRGYLLLAVDEGKKQTTRVLLLWDPDEKYCAVVEFMKKQGKYDERTIYKQLDIIIRKHVEAGGDGPIVFASVTIPATLMHPGKGSNAKTLFVAPEFGEKLGGKKRKTKRMTNMVEAMEMIKQEKTSSTIASVEEVLTHRMPFLSRYIHHYYNIPESSKKLTTVGWARAVNNAAESRMLTGYFEEKERKILENKREQQHVTVAKQKEAKQEKALAKEEEITRKKRNREELESSYDNSSGCSSSPTSIIPLERQIRVFLYQLCSEIHDIPFGFTKSPFTKEQWNYLASAIQEQFFLENISISDAALHLTWYFTCGGTEPFTDIQRAEVESWKNELDRKRRKTEEDEALCEVLGDDFAGVDVEEYFANVALDNGFVY